MKEFKGTPGPWEATKNSQFWEVIKLDADGYWDCTIGYAFGVNQDSGSNGEMEANAKLQAAAPELLEALIGALEQIEVLSNDGVIMKGTIYENRARAAIAKALGEDQ